MLRTAVIVWTMTIFAPLATAGEKAIVLRVASPELLALDDALELLSQIDARKGRVVELRYFGGLSAEESAEVLRISPETVKRDWKLAKAWLYREVTGGTIDGRRTLESG